MEDVVMTDVAKEEIVAKETKDTSLYQDYRRLVINLEKAVSLKDTKTLYLYSRLLNKFRRGFTNEDIQYLCDNYLRSKYGFSMKSDLEASQKVKYINKNRML
jgi:hypothetical protein